MKGAEVGWIVTCEHASRRLPAACGSLGLSERALRSHIAWDPGAREVARALARSLRCPYFEGRYSRLLIDLNRSEGHPKLIPSLAFSVPIPGNQALSREQRRARLERYWKPHHAAVERSLCATIARRRACVHLAVHSFTPVMNGARRACDVGFLFDPARPWERRLALAMRKSLRSSPLNVRFNYPYRGTSDGFTTAMRKRFSDVRYAGLEIEVNQSLLSRADALARIANMLTAAVKELIRQS